MVEDMIVCPICTQIIRGCTKNNGGSLFICKHCKTEIFVKEKKIK